MMPADQIRLTPARGPLSDEAYRPFILVSLLLAIFVGFALGIHVAVSRLMDTGNPLRTADFVQSHGQAQVLGFAGLYVMGMSLRLFPRFSGAKVALTGLLPAILGLIGGSLALRAVVLPMTSGELHDVVLLAVSVSLLAGTGAFGLVIAATAAARTRPLDISAWAFISGAAFLVLSSIAGLWLAIDTIADDGRSLSYLSNNALVNLQLSGFLLSFILGVTLRAIPTMVGLDRPDSASGYLLLVLLIGAVLLLAGSLLYLDHGSFGEGVSRVAGAAFALLGLVLLGLSWQGGALRSLTNRLRPASQPHLWLVRSAFVWMAVAGGVSVYYGASAAIDGVVPGQFAFDAFRHSIGLGVVTMLISGMSLMIIPEFAVQRQRSSQSTLAYTLFGLFNLATFLRVAPALAGTAWSYDLRNASMAAAGSLAEAGIIVLAFSLLRLFPRGGSGVGGQNNGN